MTIEAGDNPQISMPPARLPARIDRSGLGGGSFFSPAPAAGSALATGAVAAATEAIAEFLCSRLGVGQVVAMGVDRPIACSYKGGVAQSRRNGRGAQAVAGGSSIAA